MPAAKKIATKKRAVRKTASKVGPKKAAAKTQKTNKKPTKKLVKKRVSTKKKAKSTVVKKNSKTKAEATKSSTYSPKKTNKTKSDQTVVLPEKISEKSLQKSLKLNLELLRILRNSTARVAFATGLSLVIIGGALSSTTLINVNETSQYASTVSSGTTTEPIGGEEPPILENSFDLYTTIPSVLTTKLDVYFYAPNLNLEGSMVHLVRNSCTSGNCETPLTLRPAGEEKYFFTINPDNLDPADYSIDLLIKYNDESSFDENLGPFLVEGSPDITSNFELLTTDIPSVISNPFEVSFLASNFNHDTSVVYLVDKDCTLAPSECRTKLFFDRVDGDKYVVPVDTTDLTTSRYYLSFSIKFIDSTTHNQTTNSFYYESGEVPATGETETTSSSGGGSGESVDTVVEDIDITTETSGSDNPVSDDSAGPYDTDTTGSSDFDRIEADSELKIFIQTPTSDSLSGTSKIIAIPSRPVMRLGLKAISLSNGSSRELPAGIKRDGHFEFIFDSKVLENGSYSLVAHTEYEGENYKSQPAKFLVYNQAPTTKQVSTGFIQPMVVEEETRDDTELAPEDDLSQKTDELLRQNAEELDEMINNFYIAKQSGDPEQIQEAKEELERKRREIILSAGEDSKFSDLLDELDAELNIKFVRIEQRVETYEEIKRNRDEGTALTDSDNDGVLDIDEIKLYGTDPNNSDSDNDGVSDGDELVKGTDPTDKQPEAKIVYESPQTSFGMVRSKELVVESVESANPTEELENEQAADKAIPARAKFAVKGRGLPSTYVTLYIFSTPTIVTVKTDADGSFIYTFDKDLEDGQHDVYVAVTDNKGAILAQSDSFTFVKKARAFTPLEAEAAEREVVSTEGVEEQAPGYNLALAIGILSLGFILLMLGILLRSKTPKAKKEDLDGKFQWKDGKLIPPEKKTVIHNEHIDAS